MTTVTSEQAKAFAVPAHTPICSKNGACRCKHYVAHVSASCKSNEQVTCESRPGVGGYGQVSIAEARKCYAKRSSDQEMETPPTS